MVVGNSTLSSLLLARTPRRSSLSSIYHYSSRRRLLVTLWASCCLIHPPTRALSFVTSSSVFKHYPIIRSTNSHSLNCLAMSMTTSRSSSTSICNSPPPSLEFFVTSCRQHLLNNNNDSDDVVPVQYVIGNEAGDADSIVSAIAWAYIMQQQQQEERKWIPIVSIPRLDINLRPDIVLLFQLISDAMMQKESIKNIFLLESLSFIDDPILQSQTSSSCLTLVDHNRKSSNSLFEWMDSITVTQIVDHHADEGYHMDAPTRMIAFQDNVANVGSTCTLAVEQLQSTNHLCPEIAFALLGVILLDTMNMDPNAGKGTDRDANAIQILVSYLTNQNDKHTFLNNLWNNYPNLKKTTNNNNNNIEEDTIHCQALFEMLQSAKFDYQFWNEQLNAKDALRMDFKKFTSSSSSSFGLSSVLLPMKELLSKENFHQQAMEYMEQCQISFLGILTFHMKQIPNNMNDDNQKQTPQREFLLLVDKTKHPNLFEDLTNYLLHHDEAAILQIKKQTKDHSIQWNNVPDSLQVQWFCQNNPKGSRKQVAPVLLGFFDALPKKK